MCRPDGASGAEAAQRPRPQSGTPSRLGGAIALALLLAGCAAGAPQQPTPTPQTTPRSTPAPAPRDVGYVNFQSRIVSTASDFSDVSRRIGEAAGRSDVTALRRHIQTAITLTTSELRWLRENPPAACYRPVHEAWRQAMLKYDEAFEAIEYGLTAPMTVADIERGSKLMTDATGLIETATLLVSVTEC